MVKYEAFNLRTRVQFSVPPPKINALLLQLVERAVLEAVKSQFESERGHQIGKQKLSVNPHKKCVACNFRSITRCSVGIHVRDTAKVRNATNLGLKVFMDARWLVTPEEGDRYPLRPPVLP